MTEQELQELEKTYQELYDICKKSYEKALKRQDLFDKELIENDKATFEIAKKLLNNVQKQIEQEKNKKQPT